MSPRLGGEGHHYSLVVNSHNLGNTAAGAGWALPATKISVMLSM